MRSFKQYLKEDFEQLKELKDFKLEVVCDEKSLTTGLGGRTSISPDGGMLFIFPESQIQCLWMANCLVEMDVIFLDSQTRVTAIHRMKVEPPRSPYEDNAAYENRLPLYSSGRSAKFAVELAAGTLDRLGIRVDSRINLARYLEEELTNIPKWWYNTKTRKAVRVARDFHIQQVFSTPEKFGLTKDDVEKFSKDIRLRDRIEKLAKPLRKAGWTEVTWLKRPNEVMIRAENNGLAQKTLAWFLKQVKADPRFDNPNLVTIQRPEGSDRLTNNIQITAFAKTGKVIRQTEIGATMARFR